MKIIDTNNKKLNKDKIDFEKGRLLQSTEDPEVYIFTTWEEVPAGEGNGEQ